MIDLFITSDCTIVLISKSLVMFISYFWIKIKLKVILFLLENCLVLVLGLAGPPPA
jgi:hypothetical protein